MGGRSPSDQTIALPDWLTAGEAEDRPVGLVGEPDGGDHLVDVARPGVGRWKEEVRYVHRDHH